MEKINLRLLYERLSYQSFDRLVELVKYIYRVQGVQLRRLNYNRAAEAIGVDRKSISRYCDSLAAKNVIVFENGGLRINPDIIKAG